MRDLRFRAWDGNGFDYSVVLGCPAFFERNADKCIEQYTGLRDRNGREVYEGDIIRVNDCHNPYDIFSVKFDEGEVYLSGDEKSAYGAMPLCRLRDYEVIGNIHENPELVKEL